MRLVKLVPHVREVVLVSVTGCVRSSGEVLNAIPVERLRKGTRNLKAILHDVTGCVLDLV
jgi:hypothetical protein